MIFEICSGFIFVLETITSIFYFENKYQKKRSYRTIMLFAVGVCLSLYLTNKLNIPVINATSFFILTFLLLYFCYEVNIKSCIFSVSLLVVFMIVTEMIVLYTSSLIFGTNIDLCLRDAFAFTIQAAIAKLLYFICIYITSKISVKEQKNENIKVIVFMSILPIASILLMHSTIYICIYNNLNNHFKILLVICNILIVLSNIVVFYIHEVTLKTNQKYTELLLTQQKEKNSIDYYNLLKHQNENSKILIHDIKKHLNSIKMLSYDKNIDISDYINNIVKDFNIMNPVDYCSNALLNLITHRYSEICSTQNIIFNINIQNTKIDFMNDPDITALFDNLLENAVEASKLSEEKFIRFSIDIRNTNFLVIRVANSCNKKPLKINDHIITSKKDSRLHGIGIKSIKRVVKKYDGNISMNYDNNEKTFVVTITFQLTNKSNFEKSE